MEQANFTHLMKKLLPRGDCWNADSSSILGKIIEGLSQEFKRAYDRLGEIVQGFYPNGSNHNWSQSILFQSYPKLLYDLGVQSIESQLALQGMSQSVSLSTHQDEPFIIHATISATQTYFSAGDETGSFLESFKADEQAEQALFECVPAFCKIEIHYKTSGETP